MNIYKCIITNDELFSNTFKMKETEIFYEVEGKTVIRTEGFDESLISANASAEEVAEGTDSSSISGVDIVLNHNLQETAYTKKQYLAQMKDYVKAVRAHLEVSNPSRVPVFMAEVQNEVKKIVKDFAQYQFFTGESMNPDGMVVLLNYREDDTPYMLFIKDGLLVEKC